MKIIEGIYRGRNIVPVPGFGTRPMTARQKKSVFGIIGSQIEGVNVLDLFCGSGSLGIEALSRGAAQVVFVDRSKDALTSLNRTMSCLECESGFQIRCGDAVQAVAKYHGTFDLVFADPPYDAGLVQPLIDALAMRIVRDRNEEKRLLSPMAAIFLRHTHKEIPVIPDGLILFRRESASDDITILRPDYGASA